MRHSPATSRAERPHLQHAHGNTSTKCTSNRFVLTERMTARRQKQRPRAHTKRSQLARSADCSQRQPQARRMNDECTEACSPTPMRNTTDKADSCEQAATSVKAHPTDAANLRQRLLPIRTYRKRGTRLQNQEQSVRTCSTHTLKCEREGHLQPSRSHPRGHRKKPVQHPPKRRQRARATHCKTAACRGRRTARLQEQLTRAHTEGSQLARPADSPQRRQK